LTNPLQFDIPQEEAYHLLYTMFSRKKRWKIQSFKEPSLIVVRTGPTRKLAFTRSRPTCLAQVMIEPKGEKTEINISFDFRIYTATYWIFELVLAGILLGAIYQFVLPNPSVTNVLFMIFLVFLALISPWVIYDRIRETKTGFIAASKEAIRKGIKQQDHNPKAI
jgi:hypothetical protein